MKKLLPSLRKRKRYLLFEVLSARDINKEEMVKEIVSACHSLLGDSAAADAGLWLIDFDGKTGILRCTGDKVNDARAVLATINSVSGEPAGIRVLRTSGTISGTRHKKKKI